VLDLSPSRLAAVGLCCRHPPPGLTVPEGALLATGGRSPFPKLWTSSGRISGSFLRALSLLEGRDSPSTGERGAPPPMHWRNWLDEVRSATDREALGWVRRTGRPLPFPPVLVTGRPEEEVLLWAAGMPHAGGAGPRASVTLKTTTTSSLTRSSGAGVTDTIDTTVEGEGWTTSIRAADTKPEGRLTNEWKESRRTRHKRPPAQMVSAAVAACEKVRRLQAASEGSPLPVLPFVQGRTMVGRRAA
jgi:hypothetical protein